MKTAMLVASLLALGLVIVPPILYLAGMMDKTSMQSVMLVGTIAWFASAPLWMGKR